MKRPVRVDRPFQLREGRELDRDCLLVFLVSTLEVGDAVVGLEVPDAGGDFVN